jgi:hypothetical protein
MKPSSRWWVVPAVDALGRTAARRDDGFPQGVLAVRVLAQGQESVHVTDDGNGAPFAGLSEDGLRHAQTSSRKALAILGGGVR